MVEEGWFWRKARRALRKLEGSNEEEGTLWKDESESWYQNKLSLLDLVLVLSRLAASLSREMDPTTWDARTPERQVYYAS